MTPIESIISDLLLRHNCVVIPSFGGFVAKQIDAQIDYKNGLMLPPRKSLLFNRQLINNDGLLIAELASQSSISYNEAQEQVNNQTALWNTALKNGERITIDKVGFLYFDQEKNICFEQDRFFNLLLSSYGLGKVHFVSEEDVSMAQHKAVIEPVKTAEEIRLVPELEEIKPSKASISEPKVIPISSPQTAKKNKSVWKYVAAACILPIAFYSVWIPMKTDVLESGIVSIQDFNPFHKQTEHVYNQKALLIEATDAEQYTDLQEQVATLDQEVSTYQYNFADDVFITIKLDKENVSTVHEVVATPTMEKGRYDFIVGCFGELENATNLVEKLTLEGFGAYIVDVKGGLHRVSATNATSLSQLNEVIPAIKANGYDGWVLKK